MTRKGDRFYEDGIRLTGHTAPVLCLAHDATLAPHTLASGSEDGTVRLWDVRQQPISSSKTARDASVLTLQCEGPVQALTICSATAKSANTSSSQMPEATILLASDNKLYAYDLRKADGSIVPANDLVALWETQDEINQVVWTRRQMTTQQDARPTKKSGRKKGKKTASTASTSTSSLLVATVDDAGEVWIARDPLLFGGDDNEYEPSVTRLVHSDQDALVLTAAWRRGGKGNRLDLMTGGSDCRVLAWSPQTGNSNDNSGDGDQWTCRAEVNVAAPTLVEEETTSASTSAPLWNPPMIHHLQVSPISGEMVAAACGDGTARLLRLEQGRWTLLATLEPEVHLPLAALAFAPGWHTTSGKKSTDRLVWTAGNDGCIIAWDVGTSAAGESAIPPTSYLSNVLAPTAAVPTSEDTSWMEQLLPRQLGVIPHGSKPNALLTTAHPATVWVADTTNDITGYRIPLQ
jgi:WD40 repeat protein